MERMPQEQPDLHLPCTELRSQAAEPRLILIGWTPERELLPKLVSQLPLPPQDGLLIDHAIRISVEAECFLEIVMRKTLHPHKQPTASAITARPPLDQVVNPAPATEVKVAH